jgi:seryl-tRNA synthetase
MPAEVTREEFEARVGVLEREVEGEKMVTRHILEQTRRNGDDLAAVKTRLDRVENRLDRVEHKLDGLASSLPTIVGEAVRDALDERDRRKS